MEIRALRPDEMTAVRDVLARAFGPTADDVWERRTRAAMPTVEAGRTTPPRWPPSSHACTGRPGTAAPSAWPRSGGAPCSKPPTTTSTWPGTGSSPTGGEGRLERSAPPGDGADTVRVGAGGLAALYAGVPVATLRRSGLLQGGDAGALSAAFAAAPFSLDFF